MRIKRALTAGVTLLAGLAGCAEAASVDDERVLPAAKQSFPDEDAFWAREGTVHIGDWTYDVGSRRVSATEWSQYGAFLELSEAETTKWYYYNGREFNDSELIEVGELHGLETSPDGRYAAWIDQSGEPKGRFGTPFAELVAVDLKTGETIVRTHEGMGDSSDDLVDLYEELPPSLVKVTNQNVVWSQGEQLTLDLETGEITEDADD